MLRYIPFPKLTLHKMLPVTNSEQADSYKVNISSRLNIDERQDLDIGEQILALLTPPRTSCPCHRLRGFLVPAPRTVDLSGWQGLPAFSRWRGRDRFSLSLNPKFVGEGFPGKADSTSSKYAHSESKMLLNKTAPVRQSATSKNLFVRRKSC